MLDRDTKKLLADVQFKTDLTEAQRKVYASAIAALEKMPGAKIREQILYLEKNILPSVASRRGGEGSPDYVFFAGLIQSLQWVLIMYDRMDALMKKDSLLHLEGTILRERLALIERELTRYTTLEDLYLTDFVDKYDEAVRERLKAVVGAKKR
jgi:hypothetical protein